MSNKLRRSCASSFAGDVFASRVRSPPRMPDDPVVVGDSCSSPSRCCRDTLGSSATWLVTLCGARRTMTTRRILGGEALFEMIGAHGLSASFSARHRCICGGLPRVHCRDRRAGARRHEHPRRIARPIVALGGARAEGVGRVHAMRRRSGRSRRGRRRHMRLSPARR